ncbi:hypothetical protein ACWGCW_05070 [Streptomyces sp. NPDC054933]
MDDVKVGETIRAIAAEEVMSRFRRLAAEDIAEKAGPHDLVTTADRRAVAAPRPPVCGSARPSGTVVL